MSTGEQFADHPDEDPQGAVIFIDEFREKSSRVRASLEAMVAGPSRQTMEALQESIAEAQQSVLFLYQNDFFKATKNPIVVSNAVSALTENIRDTMACIKVLSPNDSPKVTITLWQSEDPEDTLRLVISHDESEDISGLGEQATTTKLVNDFADLILERDAEGADKISNQLAYTSNVSYQHLQNNLLWNPKVQAYMEKEARNDRIKALAMKGGGFAVAAFAGTIAAELVGKYL